MTIQILADITPSQQQAAIDLAKDKPQNIDEMADGDLAIFEISQTWGKTEEWVKRYLASTFLIVLSLMGGVMMINDGHHDFERVRTTSARKREDV